MHSSSASEQVCRVFRPADSARDHFCARGGEGRVEGACELDVSLPEARVALRQRRAIPHQRAEVLPVGQREHAIEIPASFRGRSARELHVGREERHRQPRTRRLRDSFGLVVVYRDALAPARGNPGGRDLGHRPFVDVGFHVEAAATEARDLLIGRAPHRAEQHRVVHCLEQIGLALGVGPEQRDPAGRKLTVEVVQVSESTHDQPAQPHYSM